MQNDLTRAVQLLNEADSTCVLCKGETTHISRKSGISPMLDWITGGMELNGFSAADKIVGKAAAMLFDLAGIREIHAQVLSQSALDYLNAKNIAVSYDALTPYIINRRGDGICPMEEVTAAICDPQEALTALRHKREQLRKG